MTKTTNRGSNLHSAKKAKNDEFYTRLPDIENELKHYKQHFKDKVVYCNCDDPKVSNFFKYFALNFKHLGLKKLITACYRNTDPDVRTKGVSDKAVWLEYTGGDYNTIEEIRANTVTHEFVGDGDFRSDESIELLKEADIVVTNPPFSHMIEYIDQLTLYGKYFLILGNMNALTYKEIFPLVEDNKLWLGVTRLGSGQMWFEVGPNAPDKTGQKVVDGVRLQTIGNSAWITNMEHNRRREKLILYKDYDAGLHATYDNHDAINIDKVADIPIDYPGVMGVPITFLGKHNPDQFDIVGFRKGLDGKDLSVGGKDKYMRVLIKYKVSNDKGLIQQ